MSLWQHDGNRVHNAAAPVVWTALDLKAIAGGGATSHPNARTLALIKLEFSAGYNYTGFRPSGSAEDTYVHTTGGHGCCFVVPNSAFSDAAMVLVPTNGAGVIEWKCQAADAAEIWLVGFVEATVVDLEVRADSAMPSIWTALDLTQDVLAAPTGISAEAFVYLWAESTGGTANDWATRPATPGYPGFLGESVIGGCSQGDVSAVGHVEGIAQKTNSSGKINIIADAVVPNTEIRLASFEETDFLDINVEVWATKAPPTAWQSLDLSGIVGAQRALIMVQVHLQNIAPGALQSVAVRTTGDTGDYLPWGTSVPMGVACCSLDADDRTIILVETDAAGEIEWISSATTRDVDLRVVGVLGANSAPVISAEAPTGLAVSPGANVSFTTSDDIQVIQNTIDLTITPSGLAPLNIIVNGIFQGLFTGTITANGTNGFDVSVDPIPMIAGAWTASAYCEDVYGESDTSLWGWTVVAPAPVLSNTFPTGSVLDLSSIRFTLKDDYGLTLPTLIVRAIPAAGVPLVVYTGSAFQTGWDGIVVGTQNLFLGAGFSKYDITINEWPDAFGESAPRRWTIEVGITSAVGGVL